MFLQTSERELFAKEEHMDFEKILNERPTFHSYNEAHEWFIEHFQERFVLRNIDQLDGQKLYYYHLIKDPEVYHEYMNVLSNDQPEHITDMSPFYSYHTVVITESGQVEVIT